MIDIESIYPSMYMYIINKSKDRMTSTGNK